MRKILTTAALAAALSVSAGSAASANGQTLDRSCLGRALSAILPEFVATDAPAFGHGVREQAREGIRAEFVADFIADFAPCP